MEDFILLKNEDISLVIDFLNKDQIDNAILIGYITKYGLDNNSSIKRSGTYYGYYIDNNLKGVLGFINNGCLYLYYEDHSILNKIVLLKTIKYHKPKSIAGKKAMINPLWERLEKTAKCNKLDECNYMIVRKSNFQPYDNSNNIIGARDYDFTKAVDFLIHVEKAFGRNPNTINDLKNRIYDRGEEENYLYIVNDNKIISQALIQAISPTMSEIGGVFTLPSYRGNYYGKSLVSKLCEIIFSRNKIPFLIVSKGNERGNKLYQSIGFEIYSDYLIIEMQIM